MPSSDPLEALRLPQYPLSAAYDPRWVLENRMGPNVMWLVESLAPDLRLEPGMRVLDLGCGKAISSIFLARELGVRVVAADLWISPSENWTRIREAGLEDLVFPLHAAAHALRFAHGYFDAIVSFDAYHYFGTADTYAPYIARFLRDGGCLGIVVPGLVEDLEEVPPHLRPYWDNEFWTFHPPHWWRRLLERSGVLTVEVADMIPEGWREWLTWDRVTHALESSGELDRIFEIADGIDPVARGIAMLEADEGRALGFTKVVARKVS